MDRGSACQRRHIRENVFPFKLAEANCNDQMQKHKLAPLHTLQHKTDLTRIDKGAVSPRSQLPDLPCPCSDNARPSIKYKTCSKPSPLLCLRLSDTSHHSHLHLATLDHFLTSTTLTPDVGFSRHRAQSDLLTAPETSTAII